jgi:hypothetical protein
MGRSERGGSQGGDIGCDGIAVLVDGHEGATCDQGIDAAPDDHADEVDEQHLALSLPHSVRRAT